MARDEEDLFDPRIVERLEKDALADHAGGTENHDPHECRLQRT